MANGHGSSSIAPLSRTCALAIPGPSLEVTHTSHAEHDSPKSRPPIQEHPVDHAAAPLSLLHHLSACTCAGRKMCPAAHSITSKDISNGIRASQGTSPCPHTLRREGSRSRREPTTPHATSS